MSELRDPRVLFAAERTLLAWNRTCLALMAFGFMIERFGLVMRLFSPNPSSHGGTGPSFWIGITFIVLGGILAGVSMIQHSQFLKTLTPLEIPKGYTTRFAMVPNLLLVLIAIGLCVYLGLTL